MAKNRIEFWFKDRNDLYRQLPVNPPEIEYSSPFGMNKINIASLGEVALPGERGLKTITFSSFFPRDFNASYREYEGGPSPWEWVKRIEMWRDDRRNIRLIIAGTPISIPVFVESFDIQPEKAGSPGDIYYTITLVEYRPIQAEVAAKVVTPKTTTAQSKRPVSGKATPKSHTVKSGDSLWKIAVEVYKDGSQWKKIYDANKKTIGKNPNAIKAGQKLVIPK